MRLRLRGASAMTLTIALLAALSLCGCTADQSIPAPPPATQSESSPNSSPPFDDAVALYLGEGAVSDQLIRDEFSSGTPTTSPFGFLLAAADATPTVSGAVSLLLAQARAQEGAGRHYVLRIDIGTQPSGHSQSAPTVVFFWNPTDTHADSFGYDMNMGPRSLGVYASEGGSLFASPFTDVVISDVTTETLTQTANGDGEMYDRIRKLTRLR